MDTDLEQYRVATLLTKEPETIAWIQSWCVEESDAFIDVGANIGIYSIFAANHHPKLTVFAIEPELRNFIALSGNVLSNSELDVVPIRLALSNGCGLAILTVTDLRVGNSNAQVSGYPTSASHMDYSIHQTLPTMSLDFAVEHGLLPPPKFIKIDVDGHEEEILQGMRRLIRSRVPESLLIEFANDRDAEEMTANMELSGYLRDRSLERNEAHSLQRRLARGNPVRNVVFRKSSPKP